MKDDKLKYLRQVGSETNIFLPIKNFLMNSIPILKDPVPDKHWIETILNNNLDEKIFYKMKKGTKKMIKKQTH